MDKSGNIFVADLANESIRKITPAGMVSTFAGSDRTQLNIDGVGSAAGFSAPRGLSIDGNDNLYVADSYSSVIRKITPGAVVSTLAGTPYARFFEDGPAATAKFNRPEGVAADPTGIVFVPDPGNKRIRQISLAGVVSTLAGGEPYPGGSTDGTGSAASFAYPQDACVGPDGSIFVLDSTGGGPLVRKITRSGVVTTIVGRAPWGYNDDLAIDGPASVARIQTGGLTVDGSGNIFLAEYGTGLIRKITPAGEVTTVAGRLGGVAGLRTAVDGIGKDAVFDAPLRITVDAAGTLYVTDGHMIRKGRPATGPAITTQPQSQTVTTGGSVQFSVTAAGAPDPTYQWYFNGGAFAGATSRTLSFSNARAADAGDYTVVVTNSLGTATSSKATLTVSTVPPPPSGGGSSGGGKGGGGGAPSAWFLLALVMLAAHRHRRSPS